MTKRDHTSSLELNKILEQLSALCGCEASREAALALRPVREYDEACALMQRTAEADGFAVRYGSPSVNGMSDCGSLMARAARGARLTPGELLRIARCLKVIRNMGDWRRQSADPLPALDPLFEALVPNKGLEDDINAAILSEDEIADRASPALADIRRKIVKESLGIREQLDKMIRSPQYAKFLQEQLVTQRDGRFVVPVKAEYKNEIKGLVHDTSGTGATYFIEPISVVEANNAIRELQIKERQEIDRILSQLSEQAGYFAEPLAEGYAAAAELDLYFAKSRLGGKMRATLPALANDGTIVLKKARHPLIPAEKIVPVDVSLGVDFDTLVITGPNTGGKTVALKTLGLMTLMAQCGLLLPVAEGSRVSVFRHVLADIGDEQSIEQSLSTFSGHMANLVSILELADSSSLVLLDELGSGTDPIEGAALAVSVIEELRRRGVRLAATTHYSELKMYALQTEGVENGSCEFSVETLSPTYRLLVGVPGRSNAFAISSRLGLPDDIIDRARELVSSDNTRFEDVVSTLEDTRQGLEKEYAEADRLRREAETMLAQAKLARQEAKQQAEKELEQARKQAQTLVERTKSQTDMLVNELEELKRQKDKADFSQKTAAASAAYNARINRLRDEADPVAKRNDENYTLPRELKVGDTVIITELGARGTVISIPDSDGSYTVQAGIIKTKVAPSGLRLVEDKTKQKKKPGLPQPRKGGARVDKNVRSASAELDLRGMTSDEAVMELDKFINDAVLAGLKSLCIIHGKGTGVLRSAVTDRLRRLKKVVRSYRPGLYGEGEDDVTIVELY